MNMLKSAVKLVVPVVKWAIPFLASASAAVVIIGSYLVLTSVERDDELDEEDKSLDS